MANLTYQQLFDLADSVGFGASSNVAAAIAMAESGGNPNAHNAVPPDDSYGLWQINMRGSLGPDRRKRFKITENQALYDPETNARAALRIYNDAGMSFRPWTTYTRDTYKQFLKVDTPSSVAGGIKDKVTDATSAIPRSLNAFGETVFKVSSNITGIIVAVVLLALGVVILLRNQITPAMKAAKSVTKVVGK